MSNYFFSKDQGDEFFGAILEQSQPEIVTESVGTSTTALNDIPTNVQEVYPSAIANLQRTSSTTTAKTGGMVVISESSKSNFIASIQNSKDEEPEKSQDNSLLTSSHQISGTENQETDFRQEINLQNELHAKGIRRYSAPLQLFCCKRFVVTGLDSNDSRSRFFAKIMAIKSIQFVLILIWLMMAKAIPPFADAIVNYANLWFYLPLTLYFVMVLVLRFVPCSRKGSKKCQVVVLIFLALFMSFVLGSLYSTFQRSPLFPDFIVTIMLIFLVMASITGNGFLLDVLRKRLIALSGFVSICVCLFLFTISLIHDRKHFHFMEIWKLWVPLTAVSTVLTMIVTVEIQSIINGRRITVSNEDWLYVATYL